MQAAQPPSLKGRAVSKENEQHLLATRRFDVVRISPLGLPQREVIRHPGAVTILPVLEKERICLIRSYRASVDQTLIELPAGTLEPNESPEATAARELQEETGFTARRLSPLKEFFLSPGILDERMHLFLATDLTKGSPDHQPDERIENLIVQLDEALAMVDDGRIHDAKTIIGLLCYARSRSNQQGF